MSAQFQLYLGEERIPVINWVNRHGPPQGKSLRFTVPTEAKARLEANQKATFRLERDGASWEFHLVSVQQHCTGTNGVRAVGRVTAEEGEVSEPAPAPVEAKKKTTTGVGIPKLDGAKDEPAGGFKREKSSLKELLLKKKAARRADRKTQAGAPAAVAPKDDPITADGLPAAQDPDSTEIEPPTARGMPAVERSAKSEEE